MRRNAARRRLLNEEELTGRLGDLGFVCVDPGELPFDEQVLLFSNARLVVGVHGAGCANLLFAPSDGVFVELYAEPKQPFFRDLAQAKGIQHIPIKGTPVGEGQNRHSDFTIPLETVLAALGPLA